MKSDKTKNPWRTIASRNVYDNPWINVREDAVVRPDGRDGIYGVVSFKNTAVGVLAVEEGFVHLVGQYRYPLDMYSWEIPEGGCAEDEEPLDAARRELEEETGLRAERWEKLGEAYLSNSVTNERAVWFLASELTPGEARPEGTEILNSLRVTVEDAVRMSLSGEISDALSQLAIMSFYLRSDLTKTSNQRNGDKDRLR